MKAFIKRYSHGFLVLGYLFFIYLPWFSLLENHVTRNYHIIHMAVDDIIPFCEVFIVPYLLWFFYVSGVVAYTIFTNKTDYYKTVIFLCVGMTLFLLISTIYPNGCQLRPVVFPRNNIFTQLVLRLYHTDTPTNLFPSIHVYNSLGAHFAVLHSERLSRKPVIRNSSLILCISIILATMLLKQHSIFDVASAFILATVMYLLVYVVDYQAVIERLRVPRPERAANEGEMG
ncbi:PAP2 superfamily protein [Lachnospiraceae bacterium]|nr:PAP2 superfamily protein [Lachnospiraceae bacterium]